MGGRGRRAWFAGAGALLAWVLACRTSAGFARRALERLSRPAAALLHRLTSGISFPVFEPFALLLGAGALWSLLRAGCRAIRRRSLSPVKRWLSSAAWAALMLAGALALLWTPARSLPVEAPPTPDAGQLEWLCDSLIDALNGSELTFPASAESLRRAPETAALKGEVVKAVRYPEWMHAAHLCGIFIPLTGEVLADVGAPAPLVPFTAVHELMHLHGIADEGAANAAAWRLCLSAGGEYADSARLWALRYALGQLGQRDPIARVRVQKNMKDVLSRILRECGGDIALSGSSGSRLPRLSLSRGDYGALPGYLITEAERCTPPPHTLPPAPRGE